MIYDWQYLLVFLAVGYILNSWRGVFLGLVLFVVVWVVSTSINRIRK